MADDKEKLYELKQNDELLGKRGRLISSRIYDILPQESKEKFKDMGTRFRKPYITIVAGGALANAIPQAVAWTDDPFGGVVIEDDYEEEPDFDSMESDPEDDIDF